MKNDKWIKCSEELPEVGDSVDLWVTFGYPWVRPSRSIDVKVDFDLLKEMKHRGTVGSITHWMLSPTPPEEG